MWRSFKHYSLGPGTRADQLQTSTCRQYLYADAGLVHYEHAVYEIRQTWLMISELAHVAFVTQIDFVYRRHVTLEVHDARNYEG